MSLRSPDGWIQFCIQRTVLDTYVAFSYAWGDADYLLERVHSHSGVITTNPRIRFPRISSNL
jgi:hypothetical protein